MPRLARKRSDDTERKILLVDDDPEYLEITERILVKEGHAVVPVVSGSEALAVLKREFFDLLLIDYYMPGMTGEELISEIRKTNKVVQIVLQTGYADEQPPRELVKRLDIQGYFNKSEGPDKLLLWVDVGLKASYNIQLLHRSREGLRYILGVTPDLHRIRSLDELLQGILLQVAGLLGATDSFLAVLPYRELPANETGSSALDANLPEMDVENPVSPVSVKAVDAEGFVATVDEDSRFIIRAGTGKFSDRRGLSDYFPQEDIEYIKRAIDENTFTSDGHAQIVPLCISDTRIGVIYLDREIDQGANAELLRIFANQAAVAIHNTRLYEMATLDQLTRVFQRGMFMQAFQRELRVSYRSGAALCLIMIDVDKMKEINDSMGHLTGDRALSLVGQAMNFATRQTDIRGRLGGDEFAIVLVGTEPDGAAIVMNRMRRFLSGQILEGNGQTGALSCSMGSCYLPESAGNDGIAMSSIDGSYFELMAMLLIKYADEALYEEKQEGASDSRLRTMCWEPAEDSGSS